MILPIVQRFLESIKTKRELPFLTYLRAVLSSQKRRYIAAFLLSLIYLLPSFFPGALGKIGPFSIVSPLPAFLQSLQQHNGKRQLFAFAPGSNPGRFDMISFTNLQTLAFYDVPVNSDGTLNTDSDGYQSFISDPSTALFQTAHSRGVRVDMTLTLSDPAAIAQLLSDQNAQTELMYEAADEVKQAHIDGVTIDFEPTRSLPEESEKFSTFVGNFTSYFHKEIPGSQVDVAAPNNANNGSLYNASELAQKSDHVFLMAYTFAVPESDQTGEITPVYGFDTASYWHSVTSSVNDVLADAPSDKVILETAWYGNGKNYPLNESDQAPAKTPSYNTMKTPLDAATINKLVSQVPDNAKAAARKNLPVIAKALQDEGILTPNILAYSLATIEHETAGTFEPIEEFSGRKSARRLGYEGGTDYFGRGFIQLTHLRNYKKIGERIGMGDSLVKNPDLASKPEVAAKILAAFFKDNGVATLAYEGNFVAARLPINPDYQGSWIASLAMKYLQTMV
ncbi:MAG TPA: glycosyl hydrolase family 18 protein [Candidatus Saccharimonadales bacterium]|nr:glycosyl hydrolase family 18 protein [Candidatus Saccharimonadales bacterium]